MSKPSIPRGTRDFGPVEMNRRNYIFSVIKKYFQLYGFSQIETPAMENISTLTGKYGEEGDQLIFKILNSRIHESKEKEKLKKEFELSLESARNTDVLTERALRYDLTVPFARFVVMHRNDLTFPFKRFQIQPVWRADNPQKGRYREFYQCDADVIGSDSLLNELELVTLMDNVYSELGIPVTIKMNNRKILSGIAEVIGEKEKIVDITVAIDKLDKIGRDAVLEELKAKGITDQSIKKLLPLFEIKGDNKAMLSGLEHYLADSEIGRKGIEELNFVHTEIERTVLEKSVFEIDITLARGLNYYTGSIFEVKTRAGEFKSSILGGGRYDDLTGIFGLPNLSGVGISFGIDRTYDVMEEFSLFNEEKLNTQTTKVLFANFGREEELACLVLARELRRANISCEVYPSQTKKMQKQFEYAEKKGIQYMCFVGSEEIKTAKYSLKDIRTGEQQTLDIEEIIKKLSPSATSA
jgi:histidyl-tRNA synthetase